MKTKLLRLNDAETDVKEDGTIEGYGSVFGIKDFGGDIVQKGAFSKSLKKQMPKMLFQHNPSQPIGVWEEAKEDGRGLRLKGRLLLKSNAGRDAYELLKGGALDGLSIGYQEIKSKDTELGRELLELNLFEVSIVTFPMLEDATVESVKALDDMVAKKRFLEERLRDAGFSSKQAKQGASLLAKEVLGERDAADANAAMAEDLKQFMRDLRD